jgi:hypothetical protein
MSEGISEGEFSRTLQTLRDEMIRGFQAVRDDSNRGFAGMNGRLDILNGKTASHAERIGILRHDVDSLTSLHSAQDVALEDLSKSYNDLSALIKTKTREAVREVAPSKKLTMAIMAAGAALAEFAWRLWTLRGGG